MTPPTIAPKPSPPQNLQATSNGTQVDLTWGAASDDRGVTHYEIYRDDNLIDTIGATTSYVDHNVAATATTMPTMIDFFMIGPPSSRSK